MEKHKKVSGLGVIAVALMLAGCLNEQITSGPSAARSAKDLDPNVAMLVAAGVSPQDISVSREENGDTAYYIEKAISKADAKKGVASVRLAYRKKNLDAARLQASLNPGDRKAAAVTGRDPSVAVQGAPTWPAMPALTAPVVRGSEKSPLGKSSQTRWDHNSALWDIKNAAEVHDIRVYIQQTGYTRLGANWIAATRAAMTNWNNVTGTGVSFVEISNATDADLIVKGALAPSGGSTTWLTPDPWVEKDSVEIYFNTGYETVFPANQKTGFAMIALGNILNIVHTGQEGTTWNGGTFVTIPGTPVSDANSLFQPAIGPNVNPVFSATDLKAIRQIYPTYGNAAILWDASIWVSGHEVLQPLPGVSNVHSFQVQGDSLFYITHNGLVMLKTSYNASPINIGASGVTYTSIAVTPERIVMRSNAGVLYSRALPGGALTADAWGAGTYRVSGTRAIFYCTGCTYPEIRVLNLVTKAITTEWVGNYGDNVADLDIAGTYMAFVVNGVAYTKNVSVSNLTLAWNNGPASNVYLSEHSLAVRIFPPWAPSDPHIYTRPVGGGMGDWSYFWNEALSSDQVALCGDKIALVAGGWYLMMKNLSNGALIYPWSSIDGSAISVRLSGPYCDYVTKLNTNNDVMTKYGTSTATDYNYYQGATVKLQQYRP